MEHQSRGRKVIAHRLKFLLIVSLVFSHLSLCISVWWFYRRDKIDLFQFVYCLDDAIPLALLYNVLIKWNKIAAQVQKFPRSRFLNGTKTLKKVCTISITLSIVLAIVATILTHCEDIYLKPSQNNTFSLAVIAFTYGQNFTNVPSGVLRSLIWTEVISYFFGHLLSMYITPTLIGCLSLLFARYFSQQNEETRKMSNGVQALSCKDVVIIQKKYARIRSLVTETDNLLSSVILLWFIHCLIASCCGVKDVLNGFAFVRYTTFFIDVFYHFLPVVYCAFLSFCASRIPKAVEEGFLLARDLHAFCNCGQYCVHGQLSLLMSHLSTPPTGMTLGGFFIVSMSTFLSLLGCTITFAIVVLQLYPRLMDKFRGKA